MRFALLILSASAVYQLSADDLQNSMEEIFPLDRSQAVLPKSPSSPRAPVHFEGNYRQVAPAKFNQGKVKGTHVHYADGYATASFTHSVTTNNALTWEIGYDYLKFDWKENPRFSQTHFHNALASLGWTSTALDKWRWVLNFGTSVDADTFNFGKTAVYSGLLWGRYALKDYFGLHIGFFAWGGVQNNYTLPVIGFDWKCNSKWNVNAVFPIDISLEYNFVPHWSLSLVATGFGGPYRFPRRTHKGHGEFHDAIFEVYAPGTELDLSCKWNPWFFAGIGGGWNFGGWILIKDSDNNHGKYFKYNGAPYAQAYAGFSF